MSLALLALAALCAVNPARVRGALPYREPVQVAAYGAAVAWIALVPVVALADAVLDVAQVASSTLRMGAGVVLVLQGALAALMRTPGPDPALPGRRAALVPVAFPVLLTPGLALVALSGALDRTAPVSLAVVGAALAAVPLVGAVTSSPVRRTVLDAVGRLTAAGLVVSGIALLLNGIFDI